MSTPTERADYAEVLLPEVLSLISIVRLYGPRETWAQLQRIKRIPAPDDVDPMEALVTILAALVPDDRSAYSLVEWTEPLAVGA